MKLKIVILLLCCLGYAKAQKVDNGIDSCQDCEIGCLCNLFIKNEFQSQQKLLALKNNWSDFFSDDLEQMFPVHKGVQVETIKLDGLGCIYPENISSLNGIGYDFLDTLNGDYKNSNKETFQRLYKNNLNSVSNSNATNKFIEDARFRVPDCLILKYKGKKDIDFLGFRIEWNAKFLPEKIASINKHITINTKRIVFFIHGYNVPYSLAQLQGNMMVEKILQMDATLKPENILFVRVFWPSGYRKRSSFSETACDFSNIEKIEAVWAYTYVSNRSYLGALTLRSILADMTTTIPIDII